MFFVLFVEVLLIFFLFNLIGYNLVSSEYIIGLFGIEFEIINFVINLDIFINLSLGYGIVVKSRVVILFIDVIGGINVNI